MEHANSFNFNTLNLELKNCSVNKNGMIKVATASTADAPKENSEENCIQTKKDLLNSIRLGIFKTLVDDYNFEILSDTIQENNITNISRCSLLATKSWKFASNLLVIISCGDSIGILGKTENCFDYGVPNSTVLGLLNTITDLNYAVALIHLNYNENTESNCLNSSGLIFVEDHLFKYFTKYLYDSSAGTIMVLATNRCGQATLGFLSRKKGNIFQRRINTLILLNSARDYKHTPDTNIESFLKHKVVNFISTTTNEYQNNNIVTTATTTYSSEPVIDTVERNVSNLGLLIKSQSISYDNMYPCIISHDYSVKNPSLVSLEEVTNGWKVLEEYSSDYDDTDKALKKHRNKSDNKSVPLDDLSLTVAIISKSIQPILFVLRCVNLSAYLAIVKDCFKYYCEGDYSVKSNLIATTLTRTTSSSSSQPSIMNVKEWVHDHTVTKCYKCNSLFRFLLRPKHHCRLCGRIFCGSCSNTFIILSGDMNMKHLNKSRVCLDCYHHFIEQRCDVDGVIEAACIGDESVLTGLVALKGLNLNVREKTCGYTALHCATRYNRKSVVKYLLDVYKCRIDTRSLIGETALHIAARFDRKVILTYLLNAGAQQTPDDAGKTPLDICVSTHCANALKLSFSNIGFSPPPFNKLFQEKNPSMNNKYKKSKSKMYTNNNNSSSNNSNNYNNSNNNYNFFHRNPRLVVHSYWEDSIRLHASHITSNKWKYVFNQHNLRSREMLMYLEVVDHRNEYFVLKHLLESSNIPITASPSSPSLTSSSNSSMIDSWNTSNNKNISNNMMHHHKKDSNNTIIYMDKEMESKELLSTYFNESSCSFESSRLGLYLEEKFTLGSGLRVSLVKEFYKSPIGEVMPAELSGAICIGDIISKVNDKSVIGLSKEEITCEIQNSIRPIKFHVLRLQNTNGIHLEHLLF